MALLTIDFSLALLRQAQTAEGAFPASTAHAVYDYAWLRDGSWCAYALDRAGDGEAAARWHAWVAATISRHEHRIDEAVAAVRAGNVDGRVMMPARFTLAGFEEESSADEEEWPNFQTDCYGFWLWSAADHVTRGGDLTPALEQAMRSVVRYLLVAGDVPCFDCWEEYPGHTHASSFGTVSAGLRDAGHLLGDAAAVVKAEELLGRITGEEFSFAGGLTRFPGDTRVDGSLLWLARPFRLLPLDSDLFTVTLDRIRDELHRPGGGVRRYIGDTFFGGTEWILLAATLALITHELGDEATTTQLRTWIASTATSEGFLPEQVADRAQSAHCLAYWRQRWGTTATPLLWSHAMHVLVELEFRNGRRAPGPATVRM